MNRQYDFILNSHKLVVPAEIKNSCHSTSKNFYASRGNKKTVVIQKVEVLKVKKKKKKKLKQM